MAPIAHTPLESFLLLRSLHPYDGHPFLPSFERASDSLKSDEILQRNGNLDATRFEPARLKELYLDLLKQQAKLENSSRNTSPSRETNPRKRKLSSPPLETLDDASNYAYLLPNLFERLYIQYRDDAIKSIEEEEQQFRSLQKEIQALELHTDEARAARPGSQGVPPISALLRETEDSAQPQRPPDPATNGIQDGIHAPTGKLHADIYKPISQTGSAENGPPYLPPPPAPPAQPYPLPSSGMDRRSSAQSQHTSASPHIGQAPLPQPDRSPASPIILPPPKGMVRSSGSPPIPSPQQTHYPQSRQHSNQHPPPRHQYYYDSQGYPIPYTPYGQTPVPIYHPHGGNMQPYHVPPVHSAHTPHYSSQPYQSPAPSQHPGYYSNPAQYSTATHPPYTQTTSQYQGPRTPSQAPPSQRPPEPSPIATSTPSTKWKKIDASAAANPPVSPTRPQSRDISPISDPGSDIEGPTPEKGVTSARAKKTTLNEVTNSPAHEGQSSRGRGGRRRGAGARGRRGRAGSVASTVADSRRSHSVTEDAATVKAEHSVAPDDSASITSVTADEASRQPGRRRRGTLRGVDVDASRLKRKRDDDVSATTPRNKVQTRDSPSVPPSTPRRAPTRPGFVLATRNFPKITQPLMNEIASHKLASLFAKPLTERDAPGYKDLILRPQDLKSIRSAISVGGRALTTLLDDLGDSAGAGAHIWVPESEDLVPPKGIVNAGQLEKELMRMFANAVMFNPDIVENRGLGPAFRTRRKLRNAGETVETSSQESSQVGTDGKFEIGVAIPQEGDLVKDAREVARDVQESLRAWREVERERESDIAFIAGVGNGGDASAMMDGVTLRGGSGGQDDENDAGEEEVKESVELEEEGGRRSKRRKR